MSSFASGAPSLIEIDPKVAMRSVLPDRIYAMLKHRILTCSMLPSRRILEKELSAELRVSRTPLREALNRLALEGLVVLLPYRGYIVAPLTIEDIRELFEVRRTVEAEAAALAAKRVTPEDIEELTSAAELRYTRGDPKTYETYLRANLTFHRAVVRCTHNTRLETIVMTALDQLQRPEYLVLEGADMDNIAATTEHREIIEALRAHDSERARALMTEHIIRSERRIITALQSTDFWKEGVQT